MTTPEPAARSTVLCAPWATPADLDSTTRALQADAEWLPWLLRASEILWMLAGRQWYGPGCTETASFTGACGCCGQQVEHPDGSTWYVPRWGQPWRGGHGKALKLPREPINEVTSVTVDGEVFSGWDADLRHGMLYRTDRCGWDVCTGTIEVSYTHGEPPPEGGVHAATVLAAELWRGATGDQNCLLPERVQSLTRQGVSMTMLDPQEFLDQGRVGIYVVDVWLRAVNPHGRGERGRVFSPDVPRLRR